MRRYIAHGVAALIAMFTLSLVLPVSEAEAGRRRGRGGCSSCTVGSHTSNYRGTVDNTQAPTPAQSNKTYDSNQQVPPAPKADAKSSSGPAPSMPAPPKQ